jgi:hypothetical protein
MRPVSTPAITPALLREWAADPAASGTVPVHPDTLRAIADKLEGAIDKERLELVGYRSTMPGLVPNAALFFDMARAQQCAAAHRGTLAEIWIMR